MTIYTELFTPSPAYKVNSYTEGNLNALKSELAACMNCSFLISEECYQEHLSHFKINVQSMFDECHAAKHTKSIDEVFLTVVKNTWRILIEFAKLCGYRRTLGGSTATESPTLNHLESILDIWMRNYPLVDSLQEDAFTRLVIRYALEIDFKIVEHGECDEIRWNPRSLVTSPTF